MSIKSGSYPPVYYYLDTSGIYWSYNNYWWDRYCGDYNQDGKFAGYQCTEARGDARLETLLFMERGGWDPNDSDCYRMSGTVYFLNTNSNQWEPGDGFVMESHGCWQ